MLATFLIVLGVHNATLSGQNINAMQHYEYAGRTNITSLQTDTGNNKHSPGKAAGLSALLPGAGQAYNKKYWKIPVIYAALGTSSYFIYQNSNEYKKYKQAYIARTDNDSTNTTEVPYTTENIKLRRDYYHRNLELSIIVTAGIYLLNILDATVDAYLFYFDINEDLGMRIEPKTMAFTPGRINGGIKLSLFF
ncbi:MAG: DUF5683 domain-containing protein [Bacteroidales bacterium]